MITLYGFGQNFGLPEVSPYVTKTEVHLRLAGSAVTPRRRSSPWAGDRCRLCLATSRS